MIEDVVVAMRYLRSGLGGYPLDYDAEAVIADQMEKRGHKGRDARSVRIGFQIGYQEGFRLAAEYACDVFGAAGD